MLPVYKGAQPANGVKAGISSPGWARAWAPRTLMRQEVSLTAAILLPHVHSPDLSAREPQTQVQGLVQNSVNVMKKAEAYSGDVVSRRLIPT